MSPLESTIFYRKPRGIPSTAEWPGKRNDELAPPLEQDAAVGERMGTARRDVALVLEEELVPGKNLETLCKQLTQDEVIECIYQAAEGLSAAHAEGVVHRDVKPSNILVIRNGKGNGVGGNEEPATVTAKVVDFGLSLRMERRSAVTRTTRTGITGGTPYFMSPEQLKELRAANPLSDVYSLGVTLFTQLGGALDIPEEANIAQVTHALNTHGLVNDKNLEALRATLPPKLQGVVSILRKATHLDPTKRYQSMPEFVEALAPFRLQRAA